VDLTTLFQEKVEETMKNQISSSAAESVMNSRGKFTPGPWIKEGQFSVIIGAGSISTQQTGLPPKTVPEREANARLIAAAPDLLEALKEMYKTCNMMPNNAPYRLKAKAAIDKAEGGK
jgi:hypothetical protein